MFNYIEAKDPKLADALCKDSYDECGNKITIGGVYKDLIPPLADHEQEGLEEDIKHFGCQCPITTWEGTIIDHRYEICSRHKLTFKTEERKFETQNDVEMWIIINQFNRRNIPLFTRGVLVFELEKRFNRRHGNRHTCKEIPRARRFRREVDRNREDEAWIFER